MGAKTSSPSPAGVFIKPHQGHVPAARDLSQSLSSYGHHKAAASAAVTGGGSTEFSGAPAGDTSITNNPSSLLHEMMMMNNPHSNHGFEATSFEDMAFGGMLSSHALKKDDEEVGTFHATLGQFSSNGGDDGMTRDFLGLRPLSQSDILSITSLSNCMSGRNYTARRVFDSEFYEQLVENLAEVTENGARDQQTDALVGELNTQFEKCQQLLNTIGGTIKAKSTTVEGQKRRLEETENLLVQRSHGSTTQACAACKYQRRKCASDCVLAPYFPHDRQRQFLNAHRLFGVSNIVKIVRHLEQPAKDHAMRTIIFQSDARAADPVGGCYRIIRDLEQRISMAKAELEIVLHHLALCRAAAHHQQQVVPPQSIGDSTMNGDPLGSCNEKWRALYVAGDEVAVADDVNSWGLHGNVHAYAESTSSSFSHHNHPHHVRKLSMEECNNDFRPILDHLTCDDDVREEEFKFDSNGHIIPSNNGILTEDKATFKEDDDCFPYIQEHDLKAAATFFSLTNCDI
ncbi:hypothetical protein BUALT_Bualt07G0158500 [Buddleja alternifolia]|uniref:LOB domain-containing protein n=1 Tax=Buddleja alternifolia TaxID=168488 RepID=A0AAV6XM09_9LAMI|nr:hypothetical protein BUALT_Bualt07G0158500 [Buddleja alternifolia]